MIKYVTPTDRVRINVGLININNSFSGQNYFPYSVGCLQAYAEKYLKDKDRFHFLIPIFKRQPVEKIVNDLEHADIVFFSAYVWNIRLSLEVAYQLKRINPHILTIFGGPQVPDRIEPFLRHNRQVDFACHGEGEQAFLFFLENCQEGIWKGVPSISYIDDHGNLVQTERAKRIPDLAALPSPYLSGAFDRLMDFHPNESWIALWETNRGCPFACTFCDWGSAIASKVYPFGIDRVLEEVDWFSSNSIEFIYCCDANFGIFSRDYDIVKYVAQNKKKYGYPNALSVQNTKNSTEKSYNIQKILGESGLNKGVTLSLQSVDPTTLKSVKRANIKTDTFSELQHRFTKDKIETYTDVILGLPGETYDSFANGVSSIIEHGQHNRMQFNNLSALPNAEMGDPDYQKKYGFCLRETDIVNIHGSLGEIEEVAEKQQLVVGTSTMPPGDWVRARVFCWITALLHFDKMLQIPFILLHEVCSLSYREMIELFMGSGPEFPLLSELKMFFYDKAKDIQNGGAEYCKSRQWLNIWWPADELVLIKLCAEEKLGLFYKEAESLFDKHLENHFIACPKDFLHQAVQFNHQLIKLPFIESDMTISLSYNFWEVYQAAYCGEKRPVEDGNYRYQIIRSEKSWKNWEDWCQEVVWYGNKKGAYLYPCLSVI